MARAKKEKVDYFPHMVSTGKTIYILEQKYGNDGYSFWFKLLEMLGDTKGHYFCTSNYSDWHFLLAKTRVSEQIATEILDTLAELDAIDKDLWAQKVIWVQKFVDNISEVYNKRKQEVPQKPVICHSNDGSSVIPVPEMRQRKEKESKGKESKEKESKAESLRDSNSLVVVPSNKPMDIFVEYEKAGYGTISSHMMEELEELEKEYSTVWVVDALKLGAEQGKCKLSYVKGILKNWKADGRDAKKPIQYSKKGDKPVKTDFTERQYDYSELEAKLLGRPV